MTLSDLATRKQDHLRIAARDDVVHATGAGVDSIRLRHRGLPGRNLTDVSTATTLLGIDLAAPILVSAMTGGTEQAQIINDRLAAAAADLGLGMTLGSGRALLADPSALATYRSAARPPLLLGNLGVGQILGPDGIDDAARLVALLDADGLSIHLNPLQEAIQPEGDTDMAGVGERIAEIVAALAPLPVVVKEVGFGLDRDDILELASAGVAAIDVAGSGGTNWALVEGARDTRAQQVASGFADWGVPTADAVRIAVRAAPGLPIIASGGLRDGVDVARCLALGAVAGGLARELLLAAREDRQYDVMRAMIDQLQTATWLAGAPTTRALGPDHIQEPVR